MNGSKRSFRHNAQGTALSVFLVILLVVIVGAAAAFVTYQQRQNTITNLNNRINTLNTQVANLQTQQSGKQSTGGTATTYAYTSEKGVKVNLYVPTKNAKVVSPVAIVGQVPGNWSSEASFPIVLKDVAGKVVAQGTGQLLGDWMTTQLVPFSAKLTYTTNPSGSGTLVLQKDNPSGSAQNEDSVSVPVQF